MPLVLQFVASFAVAGAIGFAWMAVWALVLRALEIPVWMRSPEERTAREEWILKLGKARYIFLFGVLGGGLGLGLGTAIGMTLIGHSFGWSGTAIFVVAFSLVGGCFNGLRAWNQLFHKEVPFPPVDPPMK
jgi:hypothetical protein